MNNFTFTRASPAFRHAVLAEHNLPRHDTQCFDVVEEAFSGMISKKIPGKRRLNAEYQKILKAEYLQKPFFIHHCPITNKYEEGHRRHDHQNQNGSGKSSGFGTDKNRLAMSSPRAMSTLRMFDINAEYWDDEEIAKETVKRSTLNRFDWVSYVDQQYENEDQSA
jgi:hypothetical protein